MDPKIWLPKARAILDSYGLEKMPFGYIESARHFGVSQRQPGTDQVGEVVMSINLVRVNSEEECRDTLLHEIAHVFTVPDIIRLRERSDIWEDFHGAIWQRKAAELGASPEQFWDMRAGKVVDVSEAEKDALMFDDFMINQGGAFRRVTDCTSWRPNTTFSR